MNSAAREATLAKLTADHCPEIVLRTFLHYYDQLAAGATGLIDRTQISPLPHAPDSEQIGDFSAAGTRAIARTVVVKLNGGLGTSMGLDKAKSLLQARAGLTFLDIIARQILTLRTRLNCPLPLLLMNSFSTDSDTLEALRAYPALQTPGQNLPLSFLQHRVPKIRQDNLQPVQWPADPEKEWCPPGHGDLYTAMVTTGILDKLLAAGFEYLFVSNSDNLGAGLDIHILGYFAEKKLPFMMEVADRTEADRKGGHVAARKQGGLLLRESAQCPESEQAEFQDISRFKYFNTNNLWVHLPSLKTELVKHNHVLGLPLIRNSKTVDPGDKNSPAVYQLETAMGSALSIFDNAGVLRVPRTRFAPVKTTDDLLVLWSDCFSLDRDMNVLPNPARKGPPPNVRLDPIHYKLVGDFLPRFPAGAPSLLACDSLTVKGDVRFGPGVTIKGKTTLTNPGPGQRTLQNITAEGEVQA